MPYRFRILDVDEQGLDNSDFNDEDENLDRPVELEEKGEQDYRDAVRTNCCFCHGDAYDCPCCGGSTKFKKRKY